MAQWKSSYTLKKGTFAAGARCAKKMWWEIHEKGCDELKPSEMSRWVMEQGIEVGKVAQRYVPGGVQISRGGRSFGAILSDSRAAVTDPGVAIVYEAGFIAHDTLVFTDILERNATGFTLIEVKSTTSVSEVEHVPDLAIQTHVLRAAGVPVTRCELMHLNRECRFPDLSNLFTREDVTEMVEDRLASIQYELAHLIAVAKSDAPPEVATGPHCSSPHDCPFMSRCWTAVGDDHITTLYMIQKRKAAKYLESGWTRIQDLPEDLQLSAIAARQRRALRDGTMVVEKAALLNALDTLAPPIAHIDFETVNPAIPIWNGCRPYDNVPVQLSCHFVEASGNVRHSYWLAADDRDPRPEMGRQVVLACEGARTVTAYYSKFEQACIRLLADACPDLAPRLLEIADNIVDLWPIVRDNVYHPAFRGSFGIKSVLPALVPDLGYDDLEIAEGQTASAQLMRMLFKRSEMTDKDCEKLKQSLLLYCERDTSAMVALTARLGELARAE